MVAFPKFFKSLIAGLFLISSAPLAQEDGSSAPLAQEGGDFVAEVGALDKITARITRLELPRDQRVKFGTLLITARACYTRPPEEPPETYIFLEIDDLMADGSEVRVFSGWMLASSPALNALEHAVYDVWAITCKTFPPEGFSGSR